MGIYSNVITESAGFSTNIDFYTIEESNYEPNLEAGFAIMVECEENYNNIMKAVGISELAYYEANGTEMVYEAVDVRAFFSKVKEFFLNILKKIAGLVKKFISLFDSWTKSDKDFVKKYKKDLAVSYTSDFSFKGYEFTNLNAEFIKTSNTDMISVVNKEVGDISLVVLNRGEGDEEKLKKYTENKEDVLDAMRGAAVSGSGTISSGEFSKEIFMKFRNGESSKTEINNVDVTKLLNTIENTEKSKTEIKNAYKIIDTVLKKVIKDLSDAEKSLSSNTRSADNETAISNGTKMQHLSKAIDITKNRANFLQLVDTALMTAIKDQNRQAKSVCVSLLGRKDKSGKKGLFEHTSDEYGFDSYLDSVVLK